MSEAYFEAHRKCTWAEDRAAVEELDAYNVWTSVRTVFDVVTDALTGKWSWIWNARCKYIEVRIDMRTGLCIIKDRNGKRITSKELKWQIERESATTPETKGE